MKGKKKMLKRFVVKNYKNFRDEIVFDFGNIAGYQFNQDCLYGNLISKAIIYGRNATGKSNLGNAVLDIAYTLRGIPRFKSERAFINADSTEDYATFSYLFMFNSEEINYEYKRKSEDELIAEKLMIESRIIFSCDFLKSNFSFEGLKHIGASTINTKLYIDSLSQEGPDETQERRMPFLRWLISNAAFNNNSLLIKLLNYVNKMYLINNDTDSLLIAKRNMHDFAEYLKKTDRLEDFERFLNAMGVECSLVLKELPDGQNMLYFKHNNIIPFAETASSGTLTATLLYRRLFLGAFGSSSKPSFLYMDEFDAFYHYEMSQNVIEYLKRNYPQTQIVFTTHNTVLMSNRIMRPDCLFLLSTKGNLTPLQKATERELREGHNLAKMYMSGEFEQYE